MNYRFTIHSELGAYILARDPIGWDKATILFKRSPKYHGVFYEKNIDLTFYCGAGKEYIDNVLDTLGINAVVTIKIEIACGCEYVPDAPDYSIDYSDDYGSRGENSCVYDELYLGKLDLKTWSTVDNKSNVNIIQEGVTDTLMNRMDTVIDLSKLKTLDGTDLTAFDFAPYDLTLHSKEILFKSKMSTLGETITIDFEVTPLDLLGGVSVPLMLDVELNELGDMVAYTNNYFSGAITADNPDILFTCTEAGLHSFSYLIQGTFYDVRDAARSFHLELVHATNNTTEALHDYGTLSMGVAGTITQPLNQSGSFDAILAVGDTVRIYFAFTSYSESGGGGNNIFTFQYTSGSYFKVEKLSTTPATTSKAFAIFEAGARIAQSLTNQLDAFRSNYFGRKNAQPFAAAENGGGSFGAITNGSLIRNFPIDDFTDSDGKHAGRPVKITFNKYFDSFNAIYNLGMGIEKVDDVFYIRVEPKDYFYQDTLLFQLSNVPNLKISVAPEYYYNKFNIGYEQWQIEQVNGLDEFNSVRQYDLGLKTIDNTLEQKSTLIAGGYLIEVTRRKQYPNSFTEDDAHDNDNFIICLNRSVDGDGIPTGLTTAEKDENFDSVSNILSPGTSYNLRISPARNALRWSPVTSVGLLKYPAQKLKFTYGEGNFKMESEFTSDACPGRFNNNSFSEGQDIQWDDADNTDNNPLWIPLIATFNYPLNRTQAKLLQSNPYGYIEISERSTIYEKWFILEAKYNPVGGMTEFKLLKKHPAISSLLLGLWAYYKFDTDANDSVGSNDGIVSTPTLDTGKINAGYLFNGTDDVIELPGITGFDWTGNDFSFTVWARLDSSIALGGIFSNRSGSPSGWITLGVNSGNLGLEVDGGAAYGSGFNPDGQGWKHYAITKSGSTVKLYIDAVLNNTFTITEAMGGTGNVARVGEWLVSGQNWDGMIDEVGIWQKELTSVNIIENYNLGAGKQHPF